MEEDRFALVIGGTSGYGAGIADKLEGLGYTVGRAGRSSEDFYVDVRIPDSVRRLIKKFQRLDVVVYSAGVADGKKHVAEAADLKFETVFRTNTLGLMWAAKRAFEPLKETGGHFIHIGSIANVLSYAGAADYCASKAAASTIIRTIREEWLGTGIRT